MPLYDKPVRYKVLRNAYIDGVYIPASTEERPQFVDYSDHPGSGLEPTCDEGKRRREVYFASKQKTPEQVEELRRRLTAGAFDPRDVATIADPLPPPSIAGVIAPNPAAVPIPADWEKGGSGDIILLAARLGAPGTVNTAAKASAFIKEEIDRRMGRAQPQAA